MPKSYKYDDFEFCGTLVDENAKCYFVDDGMNRVAIPKSMVRRMRRASGDYNWILIIPYWLAQEKGIV